MRTLEASAITRAVRDLCITINHRMGEDMLAALERARAIEESELGRSVLDRLLENARVARERWFPICQDTGSAVVFADVGQDLHVTGGDVEGAINEGVRLGYRDGYLRASIVRGPIDRTNTQDNTPAIVYYRIVPGDRLDLAMLAKGAGCDNMSRLAMLTPSDGYAGDRGVRRSQHLRSGTESQPAAHRRRGLRRHLRAGRPAQQARASQTRGPAQRRSRAGGDGGRFSPADQ